jgi:uracil-DNA glycosylase
MITGNDIIAATADLDDEYKQILVRDNKTILLQCIKSVNKSGESTPPPALLFNAFKLCPFQQLKVVIIGQDPYPNGANGCSFSIDRGQKIPPSLKNIFKCLAGQQLIAAPPAHGNLDTWAAQGVLLLNAALTTAAGKRGSHLDIWAEYIDKIIGILCERSVSPLIFILWGKFAQTKEHIVVNYNYTSIKNGADKFHRILKWGHPSPLNVANQHIDNPENFLKCTNFAECNEILLALNKSPIDWNIV